MTPEQKIALEGLVDSLIQELHNSYVHYRETFTTRLSFDAYCLMWYPIQMKEIEVVREMLYEE